MNYISISKTVLQDNGWYIQKAADAYDNTGCMRYQPYVVGFCPVCEGQHSLMYVKQSKDLFIFYCLCCKEKMKP